MRKKIVAGNWKMNLTATETINLLEAIKSQFEKAKQTEVIVAPPSVNLHLAVQQLSQTPIQVAAQNVHHMQKGAYTGEISTPMLTDIGVHRVIIGHSERRSYNKEDDLLLKQKIDTALEHKMAVIFCFGEALAEREKQQHFDRVKAQLTNALFHLDSKSWTNLVLAYEPVWAIGTGKTATPEQAQEMHVFIRKTIADTYSKDLADRISILYGGSVKPSNAREIFGQPDVDGGLIGGASLDANSFLKIVESTDVYQLKSS